MNHSEEYKIQGLSNSPGQASSGNFPVLGPTEQVSFLSDLPENENNILDLWKQQGELTEKLRVFSPVEKLGKSIPPFSNLEQMESSCQEQTCHDERESREAFDKIARERRDFFHDKTGEITRKETAMKASFPPSLTSPFEEDFREIAAGMEANMMNFRQTQNLIAAAEQFLLRNSRMAANLHQEGEE